MRPACCAVRSFAGNAMPAITVSNRWLINPGNLRKAPALRFKYLNNLRIPMQKWILPLLVLLMVGPILAFNPPAPYTSGGGFLGSLHVGARISQICVFNTSMFIIIVAVVGLSIYAKAQKLPLQIFGILIIMAGIQMFCANRTVTFIVVALLVVKPMLHQG